MQTPAIIKLPKFLDDRGNLSVIENQRSVPFTIARSYWIYDVPGGESRSGHAYNAAQEFIVALSGSFDVVISDGAKPISFHLNRSYYGLFIPRMTWRELENFSTNSLALVLTDQPFTETDYIMDFDKFIELKNA